MGLIDDIKNMQPISEHKWTLKELLKIEKKLLKKDQKSVLKKLMKKDKPIYQREKVEQDGDDEKRNAIR